jgi:uroporphyrinogen decarboxylase
MLPVDHTPIWLMRQAGRYMPEYHKVRASHTMLETINQPELSAEITMQPVDAFGVDAAIIFSDILPPLVGMGLHLEYIKGVGPKIDNPIATAADVEALRIPPADELMPGTLKAIELVTAELSGRGVPLIGFAGAPFTLACYAIEGGGSNSYEKVKALMYREPDTWDRLMTKLTDVQADYLSAQAVAGASALQIFDSWAGQVLGVRGYERFVAPYNQRLFQRLATCGVPVVNFSTGTGAYIERVAQCGGDVVGVDWRLSIDSAWERIGPQQRGGRCARPRRWPSRSHFQPGSRCVAVDAGRQRAQARGLRARKNAALACGESGDDESIRRVVQRGQDVASGWRQLAGARLQGGRRAAAVHRSR